ncbi:MAG: TlpA disulfide reductase family protein [Pirellulaceae bacterium]
MVLAFIGQIDRRVGAIAQNGVDNEETLNQIGQLLDTKNTALDRLLAPGIDEQTRLQMLSLKLVTLQQMSQIHYPGADEKYLNLLQSMSKDLNPLVLAGSRTRLIEYYAVKLLQTRSDEAFEDLREAMLVPLREREIAPQTVQMVQAVIQQMFTLEERERARALLAEIAPILIDHPDEQLKQVGNAFLDQLTLAELDFDKARIAVYREEEGAIPVLLDRAEQLLTGRPPSLFTLDAAIDAARVLELSHNFAESLQLYQRISQVAAAGDDPIAATTAARSERRAGIRLNLIGQPLELEGKVAGGADFNWAAYRGKVVLVVFWDSEAGPAIDEFDTIRDLRSKYREKGFDVVGVNLDASPIEAERFLSETPVPWVNIVSSDPDRIGFEAPMAIRCGVDVMPFHLLVDREGKVIDMHIYHFRRDLQIQVGLALGIDPSELPERLSGPLQPPGEEGGAANTEGSPEGEAGSPSPGDGEANEGATEGAAESTAPEASSTEPAATEGDGTSSNRNPRRQRGRVTRQWQWISAPALSALATGNWFTGTIVQDPVDEEGNPYLADPNASTADLVDFLLDLQDKPRSLQNRTALIEAVEDAADRILADPEARVAYRRIAALEKLAALHRKAWDDDSMQVRLVETIDQVADIEDARVQREVEFLRLETEALAADETMSQEARIELLERLKEYFAAAELEDKHLRLASASVGVVNDLTGDDEKQLAADRDQWFKEFGKLWSESEGRQLAGYGRRIAASESAAAPSVVGSVLELAGDTQNGLPFDMEAYRGKVVVVDFWATWCGPCRRELPNVEKTYAELHERGLELIGVSLDQDQQALTDFLETHPLPWVTLSGDGARNSASGAGVRAIPTMMLLDREGKVVAVANRIDQLRGQIDELLANNIGLSLRSFIDPNRLAGPRGCHAITGRCAERRVGR